MKAICLFFASMTLLCFSHPLFADAEPTGTYRANIITTIQELHAHDIAIAGYRQALQKNLSDDPDLITEQLNRLREPAVLSRLDDRLIPLFATKFSPKTADKLVNFLNTAAGRKMAALMLLRIENPSTPLSEADFTPAEKVVLANADKDKELAQGFSNFSTIWYSEQAKTTMTEFFAVEKLNLVYVADEYVAKHVKEAQNANSTEDPILSSENNNNAFFRLAAYFSTRAKQINGQYAEALKNLTDLHGLLGVEILSSPARIQRGLDAIPAAQQALEQRQDDVDALIGSTLKKAGTLSTTPFIQPIVERWKTNVEASYSSQITLGENQRRLMSLYQRVLILVQNNESLVEFKDNKILFKDVDLLKTYNSLIEQVTQELARERQLSGSSDNHAPQASSSEFGIR
jgi:hypothetical protein